MLAVCGHLQLDYSLIIQHVARSAKVSNVEGRRSIG